MSLAEKFAKTKLKGAGVFSKVLEEPKIYHDTGIPALNLAYTSYLEKGPFEGVTSFAGKSKSFKTLFGLLTCKAYLDADPECVMIFYDSEGGASESYFTSVGIDTTRVIYIPIMNIEELKFDMVQKLDDIKLEYAASGKYQKFVWLIDSIGNLASIKETNDALTGNTAADMTRAKQLKSFWRMVTPYFKNYKMRLVAIQHTYDEMAGMGAPKQIMSGGQGGMLSSDDVFILGKRQIKEGKEVVGWQFILNVEKSRSIREKAAIPFDVTYDGGIDKYSALLEIALVTGHVERPKIGWFTRPSIEGDKSWRRAETSSAKFWDPLLADESFTDKVHDMYALENGNTILQEKLDKTLKEDQVNEIDPETGEVLNSD